MCHNQDKFEKIQNPEHTSRDVTLSQEAQKTLTQQKQKKADSIANQCIKKFG